MNPHFPPFLDVLSFLCVPFALGFSSSKSSTASSQSSQTSTTYNTTDRRVGVEGEGNVIAGEGANVEISVTDVSDQIATAAVRAASDSTRAAVDSNRAVSETALRANVDVTGRAVQAVSATYADLSADQVRLLSDVVKSNAETTEATRAGNQRLAESALDKALVTVADSKTDTNEKIVTSGIRYLAYTAIGIAFAYYLTRRKAA